MTPRPHARTRRAALATLFAGASLLTVPGCDPRTLLYFLQPFDPSTPAPGPSLKGKKVVILTHVAPGAGEDYADLSRDLTREVVAALKKKLNKKVEIVKPEKVAEWAEAHPSWTDPWEAAKAFEADVAIMLDVSEFQSQDPKSLDLMLGTSSIGVQVWEVAKPKESKEPAKVYSEQVDTEFPKRGPVSSDTGVSKAAFRFKFLKLVANEISWQFVEHAPEDDIQDVKFNSSIQ